MQRWWLVVAGVVGIGLAVLLVPRPDTGDDVSDRPVASVMPGAPARADDGEPTLVGRSPVREGQPTALGPDGTPLFETPGMVGTGKEPSLNPRAARLSARMDTPEGRYAGKALAPWTQVRRLIAMKTTDAGELGTDVERMVEDMRTMLRDPPGTDAADIEKRQVEIIAEIRESTYHDEEVEKMLTLIETRLDEYRADRDGTATAPSEPIPEEP